MRSSRIAMACALMAALAHPFVNSAQRLLAAADVAMSSERGRHALRSPRRTNAATLKRQARRRRNIRKHPRGVA